MEGRNQTLTIFGGSLASQVAQRGGGQLARRRMTVPAAPLLIFRRAPAEAPEQRQSLLSALTAAPAAPHPSSSSSDSPPLTH